MEFTYFFGMFIGQTNKWEDALKTRKLMRTQNIRKTPGCSWIEVNGFVHEFTAENKTYPLATDMLTILEVLAEQSRSIHDHFNTLITR